jgi:ABC-type multidrug transport system ATPase subunit
LAAEQVSPLLEVVRLGRRFGDRQVINALELSLERGERTAMLGPNGSGKSTVLRCIAGALCPTAGSILIGGQQAGSLEARRLIGVSLSQERSFYLRLSGRANLIFFARVRGLGRRDAPRAVAELEEELHLGDFLADRTDRYSTGMILQLGFARALLGDPPLLLLDEPTRSLDSGAVERLWAAIERRKHAAILMATHRDGDVAHCDSTIDLPQ